MTNLSCSSSPEVFVIFVALFLGVCFIASLCGGSPVNPVKEPGFDDLAKRFANKYN